MPEKILESFEIRRLEILDPKGEVDESLMPSLSADEIKKMYELMILSRTFDQRAIDLQREGRLGTYASILGQEATQVGSAFTIQKSDWIFPSFREMGVYMTLGYPIHQLYQYWAGDERGLKAPEDLNIFPICVPIGTQMLHAAGAAMAAKYKRDPIVVITYFGDGATSEGDFHEAFNMAGVFKLPVVFICQNNHWAISLPRERQTAAKTLAQKAYAYGFEGIQLDGNDIFAVYKGTKDAIEKARRGEGPVFIECVTYRMSSHTTADDATRYRSKEEVEMWKLKDPILRLKLFMERKGLWTEPYQKEIEERSRQIIDEAVRVAESVEPPHPEDMFTYTYAKPTFRQLKQMEDF
ncbi:MAG TPA: pyruvate dehydrogenase (acetyl-transferring) E1 component subunit alpha [Candidatus Limnocylindrales bacterium]|nr:pyruvate dehydrogenase (acetyl-transferring) E1 component subunit alpha [Candidatus Limnocylindrales bacterium]